MAVWWYIDKYDPFHLPTLEQVRTMGNYSAPPLYWFVKDLMFALCPGLFLQVFMIDASPAVIWFMWVLAVLLNGPIYYCLGLVLVALMKWLGRPQERRP
jgi:hypothetical protein